MDGEVFMIILVFNYKIHIFKLNNLKCLLFNKDFTFRKELYCSNQLLLVNLMGIY